MNKYNKYKFDNGVIYEYEEQGRGDCRGCAFQDDVLGCAESQEYKDCSEKHIIWLEVKEIDMHTNNIGKRITLEDKEYIAVQDNDMDYLDCSQCAFKNRADLCYAAINLFNCSQDEGFHFKALDSVKAEKDVQSDLRPDTVQIKDWKEFSMITDSVQQSGTKYDQDKLQYSLIPPFALEQVAKNLTAGLKKYKEKDNWKKVQGAEQRYLDALYRHLEAHRRGEVYDKDSNLPDMPHMAAVAVNAMFLLEFMLDPKLTKENK